MLLTLFGISKLKILLQEENKPSAMLVSFCESLISVRA